MHPVRQRVAHSTHLIEERQTERQQRLHLPALTAKHEEQHHTQHRQTDRKKQASPLAVQIDVPHARLRISGAKDKPTPTEDTVWVPREAGGRAETGFGPSHNQFVAIPDQLDGPVATEEKPVVRRVRLRVAVRDPFARLPPASTTVGVSVVPSEPLASGWEEAV